MPTIPSERRRRTCVLALLGASVALGQSYNIQTVAGITRLKPGAAATSTPLRYPWGTAEDTAGSVYFSDALDNRILKIDTSGNIHIVAGNGVEGFLGDGGPALNAELDQPRGLCLDGKGGLYFVDWNNSRVRKVDLNAGTINTVAGSGNYNPSGDGSAATAAGVSPTDIAVDSSGNLYIADFDNNQIRKVSAADQTISTIAGQNFAGQGGDNGPAKNAILDGPTGISVSPQGIVYFADYFNNYVRSINLQTGMITAFAGNGNFNIVTNKPAVTSPLLIPLGTAVEASGNVLILELNYLQRVTVSTGILTTIAGSMNFGYDGDSGPVSAAIFALPFSVAAAPNGDIILADTGNFRIRRIRGGLITTIAGTAIVNKVPATSTYLNQPGDVVANGQGGFTIADTSDSEIRSVINGTINAVAGNGIAGSDPGELNFPEGLGRDSTGSVYAADTSNNRVVRFVNGGSFTVVAGNGNAGYQGDHGYAPAAYLNGPTGVVVDAAGNVYIADTGNCAIRKVDTNQTITTLVGGTACASTGNNGPAANAEVAPTYLALDNQGNLYFAETLTNQVRKLNLNTMIVTPVAGVGTPGYSGDGGPAATARLNGPYAVSVDSKGNVFISDAGNAVIRMITGTTIWTVAGTGSYVFDQESGPALGVSIAPNGLFADTDGSIYIADQFNDRIRRLTPTIPAALAVSSGNIVSGVPGSQLAVGVTVTDANGVPVGNATVTFTVTQGSATLSASTVQTNGAGVALIQVTLGAAGTIQITAQVVGLTPTTLTLTSSGPQINAGGVEGAGLSAPAVTALSVGGIASVFGSGFGAGSSYVSVGTADLVNGAVPTTFKGLCVDLSGTRAPIFGASKTQVNFQVPAVTGDTVSVRVVTNCGTTNEVASIGVPATIAAASPEFFYFVTNANGHNPVAATDAITAVGIAAASLFPGSGWGPAHAGEYVTVYATGFGATNPAVAPGAFFGNLAQVTGTVQVTLNGQVLPAASVLYTGITPSSPGLYQVNFQIPSGVPSGDLSLTISIGGVSSPAGAYITVQ